MNPTFKLMLEKDRAVYSCRLIWANDNRIRYRSNSLDDKLIKNGFHGAIPGMGSTMSNNRLETRPWSPEEEAQLLKLIESGMTASEVGQELGRTRLAVYGRLLRFRKQQGRVSRTSGRLFPQWAD
ncbi:hypothetical protein [Bradyrhizobium sp. Rc3b]|uniref:hypothetical protein n=1 Tax=Bradyrhizobium sp. Rc3b TaxID=1855322 RepID=UPI001FCD1526|nr:hypothetical protein [Bradyrhizobium sp. Rc3b]